MPGYIKIDRKILEWEWYGNVNTKVLFLHCLIKANWKDEEFEGKIIPKGSFATSISRLSEETMLTSQELRTAIFHLKSTGEINVESNNRYSVITVNNYRKYQSTNLNESYHATDKQTEAENVKTESRKGDEDDINNTPFPTSGGRITYPYRDIIDYLNKKAGTKFRITSEDTRKHIRERINEGYTIDDFRSVIDKKVNEWKGGEMEKYLRPSTLFGSKFEGYLNQTEIKSRKNGFSNFEQRNYDFDELEKKLTGGI